MSRELSKSELKEIDKAIDADFESTVLPAGDLYAARWALLTAGEDFMRLAMQMAAMKETNAEREAEQEKLNVETDLYKYRLQNALALCARRLRCLARRGRSRLIFSSPTRPTGSF
jgi:hypothetical protein